MVYSLLCEVELDLYPSSVEVIGCLAKSLPLLCEVVFVLPQGRLYWLREEFGTPSGLEILLGEGGDVELGARTSKHIFLFAFDRLALNSLSLLFVYCIIHIVISYMLVLCLALIHIAYSYMLGCVCLCASLVPNHESFI